MPDVSCQLEPDMECKIGGFPWQHLESALHTVFKPQAISSFFLILGENKVY
jgi:hypothetical protein